MTSNNKKILTAIIFIFLLFLAYYVLNMPDTRTTSQKLGDAIHDLDKGPEKAARQLENRTPGEKIGDSIKDVGDNVKRNTAE
jgi:hypothetical protein